jgi:hypothetical protein
MALNFSSALDEMFKLNGLGALELSVEEKKSEVSHQKLQLSDLESRIRETTECLRRLEAKHRRYSTQNSLSLGSSSSAASYGNERGDREAVSASGNSDASEGTSMQSTINDNNNHAGHRQGYNNQRPAVRPVAEENETDRETDDSGGDSRSEGDEAKRWST